MGISFYLYGIYSFMIFSYSLQWEVNLQKTFTNKIISKFIADNVYHFIN